MALGPARPSSPVGRRRGGGQRICDGGGDFGEVAHRASERWAKDGTKGVAVGGGGELDAYGRESRQAELSH